MLEPEYIDKLAKIVTDNNLTEISLEEGKLTIKKENIEEKEIKRIIPEKIEVQENKNYIEITSPIVGTFYASPSPGSKPFVKVGDYVTPETTVCIIEAMKLMNEIKPEKSGKIIQILCQDGECVEYGKVLMKLEE